MNSAVDALLGVLGADLFKNPLAPGTTPGVGVGAPGAGLDAPPGQGFPPGTFGFQGNSFGGSGDAGGGVPPSSTGGAAPPLWNPTGKYPDAIWGGSDNVKSHTPPQWIVDMVNQYKQNPTSARYNHILNGPYGPDYSGLSMPDWLKLWLSQAMGADPSVSSKGGI